MVPPLSAANEQILQLCGTRQKKKREGRQEVRRRGSRSIQPGLIKFQKLKHHLLKVFQSPGRIGCRKSQPNGRRAAPVAGRAAPTR